MDPVRPTVTVFGSLHYDIMVHGPARPRKGETVVGTGWAPKCGGKGCNQAVAAARAGAQVAMIGAVGDDEFGRIMLENLDHRNVDRKFVRVLRGSGSGMSVAIFDGDGDYGAVIVSGTNLALGEEDVSRAAGLLSTTGILLLQNEVPDASNLMAARKVRAEQGRILFNAAPARTVSEDLLGLVDILVVNAIEAEFLARLPVVDTLEGAQAAAALLTTQCREVIVTAGGAGVAYANRQARSISIPAERITVESTHGAGDEFLGALAASLVNGAEIETALAVANHAAAVLVSTPESART